MIIVNPDEIAIFNVLRNDFGKRSIGFGVRLPSILIERDLARMVVEERP